MIGFLFPEALKSRGLAATRQNQHSSGQNVMIIPSYRTSDEDVQERMAAAKAAQKRGVWGDRWGKG